MGKKEGKITTKKWLTCLQLCQEAFLPDLSAVSGCYSAEEGCTGTNAYWKTL